MKKFITILIALAMLGILCPVPPAHALSVGAPARTLESGGFSLSGSIGYATMDVENEEVTSKSFFLKGAFPAGNRITPYLKLGFADLEVGPFEGSLDFAYGGGVLLDLIGGEDDSGFKGSLDAQILWVESGEGGVNLDLLETQVALMGSIRTGGTSAYAGIASSFLSLGGGGLNEDENGQSHLFFGADYYMDYNFYLNVEAHLFGQDMLNIGVGYEF